MCRWICLRSQENTVAECNGFHLIHVVIFFPFTLLLLTNWSETETQTVPSGHLGSVFESHTWQFHKLLSTVRVHPSQICPIFMLTWDVRKLSKKSSLFNDCAFPLAHPVVRQLPCGTSLYMTLRKQLINVDSPRTSQQ